MSILPFGSWNRMQYARRSECVRQTFLWALFLFWEEIHLIQLMCELGEVNIRQREIYSLFFRKMLMKLHHQKIKCHQLDVSSSWQDVFTIRQTTRVKLSLMHVCAASIFVRKMKLLFKNNEFDCGRQQTYVAMKRRALHCIQSVCRRWTTMQCNEVAT